ncbi:MAG: NADP-dependent oxidoreductase [Mucilaginibacter sp.]|nr:NADP-dependent oxidoreductase [Mucilaginibacter sp.]
MKAIILKQAGGVDKLLPAELPEPTVRPSEVLIKVKAISINPVDTSVRSNGEWMKFVLGLRGDEPYVILGWDISGVVTEVGADVKKFMAGDEVFGLVNFPGQGKAYAEFVAAEEIHMALKPVNISHQEAAGATLAALTAWQALVTYGQLIAGEKVLVQAAAGGVGHYAVQIARHLGAYVIGTGSAGNKEFILGLGAHEFIDYHQQRIEAAVTDADLTIDAQRDTDHIKRSIRTVRDGGRLVALVNRFDDPTIQADAAAKKLKTISHLVSSSGEDMRAIAQLLKNGSVKTHIYQQYSFDEIPEAHLQIATGRTRGKIIIVLDQ